MRAGTDLCARSNRHHEPAEADSRDRRVSSGVLTRPLTAWRESRSERSSREPDDQRGTRHSSGSPPGPGSRPPDSARTPPGRTWVYAERMPLAMVGTRRASAPTTDAGRTEPAHERPMKQTGGSSMPDGPTDACRKVRAVGGIMTSLSVLEGIGGQDILPSSVGLGLDIAWLRRRPTLLRPAPSASTTADTGASEARGVEAAQDGGPRPSVCCGSDVILHHRRTGPTAISR